MLPISDSAEWLEADGLGGFASGTTSGVRTRRYHALLLTATTPPSARTVLVNGLDAWIETPHGNYFLSSQRYAPDIINPDGTTHLTEFQLRLWPKFHFTLRDDLKVDHELFVPYGQSAVVLSWRLVGDIEGAVKLCVRPFLSGRDFHATHHENTLFQFDPQFRHDRVRWKPYANLPAVVARSASTYRHSPAWYRNFLYTEERARGLDYVEDLASPGVFRWDLTKGDAVLTLAAEGHQPADDVATLRAAEQQRRRRFPTRLHRSADAYLVRRGTGKTIVAGYPWFTDWGRDTFIALRGLCLATGRLEDARAIVLEWAGAVSEGMLPNRFPDRGETPEFNAVDAALWYVVAVHDLLQLDQRITRRDRQTLEAAIDAILSGYSRGTRYNIHADDDGLLAAGEPGVQLTWMDAKVGDWVVTPRIGKPVEVQALWLNALQIGSRLSDRWGQLHTTGRAAFEARFWNEGRGMLHDVVDVDHRAGTVDATFRPNQILAVGGLPFALLEGERARRVVDAVEAH